MPKPSPIIANSPVVEEPVSGAGNKLFQEFKLVDTLLTLSHSAVSEYLLIYFKKNADSNNNIDAVSGSYIMPCIKICIWKPLAVYIFSNVM